MNEQFDVGALVRVRLLGYPRIGVVTQITPFGVWVQFNVMWSAGYKLSDVEWIN